MQRIRHIVLLIILLCCTPVFQLGAQTSTWWYPLGNTEATRQARDTSKNQKADDLKIRWKTSVLHNSPTVLVGAIRSEEVSGQQVVGLFGDTLMILSSMGMMVDSSTYLPRFSATPNARFTLTGLFNTAAPTPKPEGKPNVIGIGVERNQKGSGSDILSLYGMLVDPDGNLYKELHLRPLPDTAPISNQSAGVYPIAAYTPPGKDSAIALAVVSQNTFTFPATDTMVNGIRSYNIAIPGRGDFTWQRSSYRIAPRAFAQFPAILPVSTDSVMIALSTAAYASNDITVNPLSPDKTESGLQYSVTLKVDGTGRPAWFDTRDAQLPAEIRTKGEIHSYFVKLGARYAAFPDSLFRIVAENHDASHPGQARLVLLPGTGTTALGVIVGRFEDPLMKDIGWSIVAGDVDGRAPNSTDGKYKNNPGNEIIGALRSPDGRDVDSNRLYILRWQNNEEFTDTIPRQRFSGRLLAAGDIVNVDVNGKQDYGKQEIIIARADTLTILQLKDYSDPSFDASDVKRPFSVIKTFALGSRILYAAIADLDGDRNNEIVVSTEAGVYVIGTPLPQPFGIITPMTTEVCSPDTVAIRWNRTIGGEGTITLRLHNESTGKDTVLTKTYPAQSNGFSIRTNDLAEGNYRLIIQDNDLPHLVDTSATFMIHTPSIRITQSIPAQQYHVGDLVSLTSAISCIDTFRVERYDGVQWVPVQAAITSTGPAQRRIDYSLGCPQDWQCGDSAAVKVLLRLVSDRPGVAPQLDSLWLSAEPSTLQLAPGDSSLRNRELQWNPADFACDSLSISYSPDNGGHWGNLFTVASSSGRASIQIPVEAVGRLKLRACCGDANGTTCDYGITELTVGELPNENFVAPNPFNPNKSVSSFGEGAAIVYKLQKPGVVRITIFDASRTVVRVLTDSEDRNAEQTYVQLWDGRNGQDEIVANGPYICIIESSSSERIVLPIIVMQR